MEGVSEIAADTGFPPGTVLLSKYRVLRALGVGGMSLVLSAEHVSLGTKVALKLLLPSLAQLPDAPARFQREAWAATRFESEHVAKVLDVGTLPEGDAGAGAPYMVIEYLEGQDLGRCVKSGRRFDLLEAVDLVTQAADALSRAHAAGVVHRDVKPSNLFLTQRPDGSPLVKVLDFGISKVVEEAAKENLELTKTSAVMGSALYMSMEQMRSPKTVDRRTDVYALGVTLYELLTGSHPFLAETFSELCVKVSLDPPIPLRSLRADVPEAFAEAVARAYARLPEDRYQSVGLFVAALLPFASPEAARRIRAIRAFERTADPGLPDPPSPSLRWAIGAILAGALIAAITVLALRLRAGGREGGADAGTGGSTGSTSSSSGTPATPIDAATPEEDGGAVDAGTPARDAGVGRPPDPCAGKKPGTQVILPNGLRRICGI
jgi:serine/threonine-protein kinase